MIVLINTILNKSSTYVEFAKLFVKRILKSYGRVGIIAGCYKRESGDQLGDQLLGDQLEKIHVVSLLSKVPSDFYNRILRNSDHKKGVTELTLEYIEREAKHCLELLGSSKIILLSKNKCILVTATCRNELFTSFVSSRRS